MEAPTDKDKCLAILVLRRAGCSQDMVASILHCAKKTVGEAEDWFKKLPYAEAVEICSDAAILDVVRVDLVPLEELDRDLLGRVSRITQDAILRRYRQDHLLSLKWQEQIDLAIRIQNTMAKIDSKDWAIWGLPDTGQAPQTSEAELRVWIERGQPMVGLAVEQDVRWSLFLDKLKASFPQFNDYDQWRKTVTDFVRLCWTVSGEIWSRAEQETGLRLSPIEVMGKGHMISVPQFIYEFALDNRASGKRPVTEIQWSDPYRYRLIPEDQPGYILAIGSKDEMELCGKVIIALSDMYITDDRIIEIDNTASQLRIWSAPMQRVLTTLIRQAAG